MLHRIFSILGNCMFVPFICYSKEPPDEAQSLKQFCDGLHKFTQFRMFKELASLTYGEPSNKCCIVSSIEFDRDGEYFAVAGVTKKIKVHKTAVTEL